MSYDIPSNKSYTRLPDDNTSGLRQRRQNNLKTRPGLSDFLLQAARCNTDGVLHDHHWLVHLCSRNTFSCTVVCAPKLTSRKSQILRETIMVTSTRKTNLLK